MLTLLDLVALACLRALSLADVGIFRKYCCSWLVSHAGFLKWDVGIVSDFWPRSLNLFILIYLLSSSFCFAPLLRGIWVLFVDVLDLVDQQELAYLVALLYG